MSDFAAERRRIVKQTDEISDPLERLQTRQRLLAELYQAQAAQAREQHAQMSADEIEADEIEAAIVIVESAAELAHATGQPDVARHMRRTAERGRHALMFGTRHRSQPGTRPRRSAPRPRGRRERHVATSTSSADSGDSDLPPDDEEDLARHRRALRRSILAGESCPMCETRGRVLRGPDGCYCTTCWAGPWLIGDA